MHLFLVDQYIALDTISPIIYSLAKREKVSLYNSNLFYNFKNEKVVKFLIKNNVLYLELNDFSKSNLIRITKIFFLLPKCIICLKIFNIFHKFFYKYYFIFILNEIEDLLIKKKIKTLTVVDDLHIKNLRLISFVCKKLDIPIILVPSGINTIKLPKLNYRYFYLIDYFLSPNYLREFSKSLLRSIFVKTLGSPRYSDEWLSILEKIYSRKILGDKKKIKIGFFLRAGSPENEKFLLLIKKLKKIKTVKCEIRDKPRDLRPSICSKFYYNNMNSTELIKWADIIMTARPSSIILEAIKRNKIIIVPTYLNPLTKDALIFKCRKILKYDKEDLLLNFINNFSFNESKKNKKKYSKNLVKKFVGSFNSKSILENYSNFYRKFN